MAATIRNGGGAGSQSFQGTTVAIITAAEANQLVTGQGRLRRVFVANVGTTATLDIYDDPTTTNNKIYEWVSADGKKNDNVDIPFQAGLRVVTGGTFGRVILVY